LKTEGRSTIFLEKKKSRSPFLTLKKNESLSTDEEGGASIEEDFFHFHETKNRPDSILPSRSKKRLDKSTFGQIGIFGMYSSITAKTRTKG
jgi:hypothetical protein